ncbi:hypothetical protein ABN197_18330 [Providencia alcalifaciens]|uniref:hypothetical protein n=1 Tax=Providencia alcalifaciens TaxID=126385 RepID=UPI0032DACC2D
MAEARDFFVDYYKDMQKALSQWLKNQTFINLGNFLLGVDALGVDAVAMESIDFFVSREFLLVEQEVEPIAMVALEYRSVDDFNAQLTKLRIPEQDIITVI